MGNEVGRGVETQRIYFNAPVRTGFRVDMQAVIAGRHAAWAQLWHAGGALAESRWQPALPRVRSNQLVFDVDDYQGAGRQPYLARCILAQHELDWLERTVDFGRLQAAEIHFFDFGIATVTVDVQWRHKADTFRDPLGVAEQASSAIAVALKDWVQRELEILRSNVPQAMQLGAIAEEAGLELSSPGLPMWIHRLLVARTDEASDGDRSTLHSHPSFIEGAHVGCWGGANHDVWVGHGTSVVELHSEDEALPVAAIRMIDLANAYWAGAQEIGSLVIARHHELTTFRRTRNSRGLEGASYELEDLHDQLALFRTLVHDQLNRLDLTDRRLFEGIAECWRFSSLMQEIEQRREDVAGIHDQALRRIQTDETSRLNIVVFVLTMISAVSVFTDLVSFVQERGIKSPDVYRTVIVMTVTIILIGIAWRVVWARSASRSRFARTSPSVGDRLPAPGDD